MTQVIESGEHTTVITIGEQGPSGVAAGNVMPWVAEAAETISALRVVATDAGGRLIYADKDTPSTVKNIAGVSKTAAAAGQDVVVITSGIHADEAWHWNMEQDTALFLGADGAIVQGAVAGAVTLRIGFAVSPTKILVRMGEPVINA